MDPFCLFLVWALFSVWALRLHFNAFPQCLHFLNVGIFDVGILEIVALALMK